MSGKLEVDITVPNETRYLGLIGKIGEDVARSLTRYGGDREELAYHLNTVLTEAIANVIVHANQRDPSRNVHLTIEATENRLHIKVYDEGTGFDTELLALPLLATPDGLSERGRGIFIIRSLMDSVTYRRINGKHVLEMVKHLN